MVFFSLFIFILGLVVGSFLSCLIYRLETDQGFVTGRSFCPHCRRSLGWPDLIPLVSFIFLRGRCRYCQKPISLQYPLVELTTGILFLLVFGHWFLGIGVGHWDLLNLVYLLLISSCLIVIFVFDLKHYLIPDEIVYSAIFVSSIWYLVFRIIPFYTKYKIQDTNYALFNEPLTALAAASFFAAIYFFSQGRAMGFGDVKLAFLLGLFLGFPNILVALFLAFFSGAMIGVVLMLLGRKKLKSELPFAPFLIAGAFFALFWGEAIIDYYLKLLL